MRGTINSVLLSITSIPFFNEDNGGDDVDVEPSTDLSDELPPPQEYEARVLELSTQETRAYIDHQIAAIASHRDRASTIVQLNLVVVGFVVTLSSFLVQEELIAPVDLINVALPFAVLGSLLSVASTLLIFRLDPLKVGFSPDSLGVILQQNPTTNEHLIRLIKSHRNRIEYNLTINESTGQKIRIGYAALFLSLLLYGGMILAAV